MPGNIIGGRRGTGQDELARLASLVNRAPDMIPDGGFNLPLIDKTRCIARQYQAGINRNCLTGVLIDIKQYFTGGKIPGCCRFAASFRPFDHNSAGG
jgi:hypothetical protein